MAEDHVLPVRLSPTLAEKVALTAGRDYWHLTPVPALDVPSILVCDGPHGVRKQRNLNGFDPTAVPATCFPTASALAATWDVELLEEIGAALGEEARAEGVSVLLGPGANIKRSALCGRNFEYFSEDPYLSSRLAAAWIRGVQSTGVGASLKHFAANNQEHRRYTVDALVDERALREIYLASFEHAVTDARPTTVMAAYNRLRGAYCTTNAELLTTILRDEWGFDGAVMSDWGATDGRVAAIAAGLDLEMPGFNGRGDAEVLAAVHSGVLSEAALDRAAGNVLRLVERTAKAREPGHTYDRAAHHALARRAAAAGTVLLRNENDLLPLPETGTIAVIGAFAQQPRFQGAGSSGVTPHQVDNLWDELVARVGSGRLRYASGYPRVDGAVDDALLAEARTTAAGAVVAVVVVGLPDVYETEGRDRTHLDLPPGHNALITAVAAANPNTVVVLANGAPVTMPWLGQVGAIVEGYLGGQAGGSALAEVLLGLAEPGGRLAETFPYALADNPAHTWPNGPSTVEYRESLFVGYRFYDSAQVAVAFPFGHGLSYTTFHWSPAGVAVLGDTATVALTVTNDGARAGTEVVQIYVHDPKSTVYRPAQELKGFAVVRLEPGASQTITLTLDRRAFAVWSPAHHDWVVEPGTYELRIGASSRDIRSRCEIELTGDAVALTPSTYDPFRDRFESVYGQPLPANVVDARGCYTVNTPLGDIQHSLARMLLAVLRRGARMQFGSTKDDPMVQVVDELLADAPPRMLTMISQGRISSDAVNALVDFANYYPVKATRGLWAALRGRPAPKSEEQGRTGGESAGAAAPEPDEDSP
jgi:beta-glucosidase